MTSIGIDVLLIGFVASALANIDIGARKRREKLEALSAYMR